MQGDDILRERVLEEEKARVITKTKEITSKCNNTRKMFYKEGIVPLQVAEGCLIFLDIHETCRQ